MEAKVKNALKEEYKILKELLGLLDNQYEFICNKKAFELDKVARDIESVSKELAKREMERRTVLKNNSIKEFISESCDVELKNEYEKCMSILHEIKIQKDTNELLIRQSINLTTNMLRILNPDKTPKTYGPYGKR